MHLEDLRTGKISKKPQDMRHLNKRKNRVDIGYRKRTSEHSSMTSHKLGIKNNEDWYSVTVKDIISNNGEGALQYHGGYIGKALSEIYPEYNWQPWRFSKVYHGFWNDLKQVRKYVEYLGELLGIKSMDEWYNISKSQILALANANTTNSKLLIKEKNLSQDKEKETWSTIHDLLYQFTSLPKVLMQVFPEKAWDISKFQKVQQGYWLDLKNQRKCLDDIAKDLNINNWTDWYSVRREDIASRGGWSFISNYYAGSPFRALMAIYSEHPWQPWRFTQTSKNVWEDFGNVTSFISYAEEKFEIRDIRDWLTLPYLQLYSIQGFNTVLRQYGGLIPILKKVYPTFDWDSQQNHSLLSENSDGGEKPPKERIIPSKVQNLLFKLIYSIFPNHIIHSDCPHPKLRYPSSNKHIQFDIFIPSLNIAFEYQGSQHFVPHYLFTDNIGPRSLKYRDEEKRKACILAGITLYEIPYWRDLSKDSLVATILKQRPELINFMDYSPSSKSSDARTNQAVAIPQVLLNEPEKHSPFTQ